MSGVAREARIRCSGAGNCLFKLGKAVVGSGLVFLRVQNGECSTYDVEIGDGAISGKS